MLKLSEMWKNRHPLAFSIGLSAVIVIFYSVMYLTAGLSFMPSYWMWGYATAAMIHMYVPYYFDRKYK